MSLAYRPGFVYPDRRYPGPQDSLEVSGHLFYLRGGVPMVGNVSVPFIYRSNRAGEHSFRSL